MIDSLEDFFFGSYSLFNKLAAVLEAKINISLINDLEYAVEIKRDKNLF